MKKLLAVMAALVFACALVACEKSSLAVESADNVITVTAKGNADGEANGNLTIADGEGIVLNPLFERGSVNVKIVGPKGDVVYNEEVKGKVAVFVEVPAGEYEFWITAKKAKGEMTILPYDKAAQAAADEALGEALAEAGVASSQSSAK